MEKNNKINNNFGTRGWWYIILTMFMFFLVTGISTDGQNVSIAKFGEVHGWDQTTLLYYCSIGGYIATAAAPFLTRLVLNKVGTRVTATLFLIVGGISTIAFGYSNTLMAYLITYAVITVSVNMYGHICISNLANSWYPKNKGMFLGWSTMGLQLSTVFFVAMLSLLFSMFGLGGAHIVLGIMQFIVAILFWITVRDTPAELGEYPDNIPMSPEEAKQYSEDLKNGEHKLSVGAVLKNRDVWFIGLGFGVTYMASVGLLSQWVPRVMTYGYSQNASTLMLSIAAAIGLFGSYAYGVLDVKFGPKKASIIISLNYVLALVLSILPYSPVTLYASVVIIGLGIGGVANLVGSLTGTIFGPKEFGSAFGVINPITRLCSSGAFALLAFGLDFFGGYAGAYAIFLVLAIIGTIMICAVRDQRIEFED